MEFEQGVDKGLAFFGGLVNGVKDDQWTSRTPCEDWDVRHLVRHVQGVIATAAETAGGEAKPANENDEAEGSELVSAWQETADSYRSAVAAADLSKEVESGLGKQPLAMLLTFPTFDLFLHGWDLGRATGQQVQIPDDAAEWIEGTMKQFLTNDMRGPHTFGPEQSAPPGADATTRLMAFTGRSVEAS
jgi:uncharacterized protein (TIGR03086 family)